MKAKQIIKSITCLLLAAMFVMPISLTAQYINEDANIQKKASGTETERWAVFFDIGQYPNAVIYYLKDCLTHHGWKTSHIKCVYESSYNDVKNAFSWLSNMADQNDIILLCSNHHGFEGGIALADKFLYYTEIDSWLDQTDVKGIFYSISACHSGSAIPILGQENRIIMTACRSEETGSTAWFLYFLFCEYDIAEEAGYEDAPSPNGAFARSDCDLNHDGWVSAEEAFPYAAYWTEKFHNEFWNPSNPIHPQIYDGYPGELNIAYIMNPPDKPNRPSGPSLGRTGSTYAYTTSAVDPNGDRVKYGWDWDGDKKVDEWTNFYDSGRTIETSHSWNEKGEYEIRVKAKDEYGAESPWSDPLAVSMPKVYDRPVLSFLERFNNWFIDMFLTT